MKRNIALGVIIVLTILGYHVIYTEFFESVPYNTHKTLSQYVDWIEPIREMNQTEIMNYVHLNTRLSYTEQYACSFPLDYMVKKYPTRCTGMSSTLAYLLLLKDIEFKIMTNCIDDECHTYVVTDECILDPSFNYYDCDSGSGYAGPRLRDFVDGSYGIALLTRNGREDRLNIVFMPRTCRRI